MKNITIRVALKSEKETLLNFEQKVVEAERPYNRNIKAENSLYYDMDNLLTCEMTKLIVAEHDNKIIATGYIQIRQSKKSLQHAQHGYLGFMYVATEFRGLGLNKKIMDNLIHWARTKGITDFYLEELKKIKRGVQRYSAIEGKMINTAFDLLVYSTDRPERSSILKIQHFGNYGKRALHCGIVDSNLLPYCPSCFNKALRNILNSDTRDTFL